MNNKIENILKLTNDYPIASIGVLVLSCLSIFVAGKNHHDNSINALPASYWDAQKAEEEAKKDIAAENNRRDIEFKKLEHEHYLENQKAKSDENFRLIKEQHDFEKNLPESYWLYKASENECDSREKVAESHSEAIKYAADKGYDVETAKSIYAADIEKSRYQEMRKMAETLISATNKSEEKDD